MYVRSWCVFWGQPHRSREILPVRVSAVRSIVDSEIRGKIPLLLGKPGQPGVLLLRRISRCPESILMSDRSSFPLSQVAKTEPLRLLGRFVLLVEKSYCGV